MRARPAVGESDACARGSDTSGRASRWPWQSSSTTPQEDRGFPGPGKEGRVDPRHVPDDSSSLLPLTPLPLPRWQARCTSGWTSMGTCLPPGFGRRLSQSHGSRCGFCGTRWSKSETLLLWFLLSLSLCQMVDQLVAVLTHVDSFVPEQVVRPLSESQVDVNVIVQNGDIPESAGGIVGTGGHYGFFPRTEFLFVCRANS